MSLIRLPKHYKETVISKPNAIANGLANAAQTATKFITEISNSGIWVTPDGAQPSESGSALPTTTGWHISDAIELFKQGSSYFKIWLENSVTKVRVGLESSGHALFTPNGMDILTNVSNRIAQFGVLSWQELSAAEGQSADVIQAPGMSLKNGFNILSDIDGNSTIVSESSQGNVQATTHIVTVAGRNSDGTARNAAEIWELIDDAVQEILINIWDRNANQSYLDINVNDTTTLHTHSDIEFATDSGDISFNAKAGTVVYTPGGKTFDLGRPTVDGRFQSDSGSSISVASGTPKKICSIDVDPGIWLVEGWVEFALNTSGRRAISITTTSGSINTSIGTITQLPISGTDMRMSLVRLINVSSSETLYLNASQNSGSSLSTSGSMRGIRLV